MKVFSFFYFPVGKESLPVWDENPLIILLDFTSDGFIGLNLHYINENDRLFYYQIINEFNLISWRRLRQIPGSKKSIHRYINDGVLNLHEITEIEPIIHTKGIWRP
jgi:hypothetical protein